MTSPALDGAPEVQASAARAAGRDSTPPHPCPVVCQRSAAARTPAEAMAAWLHELRPWRDFATMTFRTPTGLHGAATHFKHFMSENCARVDYFVAFEPNPGSPGYHAHALLHGLTSKRREVWKKWFDGHGRNRIEPILSKGDVLGYCAKYVTKCASWWDLKLFDSRSDRRFPGG